MGMRIPEGQPAAPDDLLDPEVRGQLRREVKAATARIPADSTLESAIGKATNLGVGPKLGRAGPAPKDDFQPVADFEPESDFAPEPAGTPEEIWKGYADDVKAAVPLAVAQKSDKRDQAYSIAKRAGQSVDLVEAALPDFQAAEEEERQARALSATPVLAKLTVTQPDAAPSIVNDPALAEVEKAASAWDPQQVKSGSDHGGNSVIGRQWDAGWKAVELSRLQKKVWAKGSATPEEIDEAKALKKEIQNLKGDIGDRSFVLQMLGAGTEMLPRQFENAGEISQYAALGLGTGMSVGAAAGGVGAVPLGLAGLAAGLKLGVGVTSGRDEGAAYYMDMLEKGIDPKVAQTGGVIVQYVNGALEAATLPGFNRMVPGLSRLAGKPFVDWLSRRITSPTVQAALVRATGRMAEGAISEGVTEALQDIAPMFEEDRAKGHSLSYALGHLNTAEAWLGRWESFKGGAMAAGGMHLASPFTHLEIAGEIADAQAAKQKGDFWGALTEAVKGSKAFESNPELAQMSAREFKGHYGMPQKVSVPAEVLSKVISQEEAAAVMPEVARQMADAITPDSEVVIQTEDLLTHVLPRDGSEALSQDIREDEMKPTAREAPEVMERAKQILKEEEQRQKEKQAADAAPPDPKSGRYVFEGVKARLMEDAKLTSSEANKIAALWQAMAESRSARTGMDPVTYFAGLNVQFAQGEFSDLTKKEQKGALTQTSTPEEEAKAAETVGKAAALGTDFTLYTPGKGLSPLNKPAPAGVKEARKDTVPVGLKPKEEFTFVKPDLNAEPAPVPVSTAGKEQELQGPASDIPSKSAREMYPLLWSKEGEEMWSALTAKDVETLLQAEDPLDMQAAFMLPSGEIVKTGMFHDLNAIAADLATAVHEGTLPVSDKPMEGALVSGFAYTVGGVTKFKSKDEITSLRQKNGEVVRGFFQTSSDRDFFKLTFGGKANFSTFVHETGHAFMAILERDAMRGDVKAQDDIRAVREWLGSSGSPTSGKWTVAQQEKFARAFEAYLWEGKAPSIRLASFFSDIAAWMKHIYASISRLDVELSDEVRGVMDRLLATDMEIDKAREELGLTPPVESAELAGMTPEAYAIYRAEFEKGVREARAQADRESLRQVRWALTDEFETAKVEAEGRAKKDKALNAREAILKGKTLDGSEVNPELKGRKLIRSSLKAMGLPRETYMRLLKFSIETPNTPEWSKTAIHPDLAASMLGYANGEELARALASSTSVETWVTEQANEKMREKYPGYDHSKLWGMENARQALHADQVGNAIWAGYVALTKKSKGSQKTVLLAIQEAARQRVANMAVMELSSTETGATNKKGQAVRESTPARFTREEGRAAKEVAEAWKARDERAAFDATRRQLLAHYSWREVAMASQRVSEIKQYLRSLQTDQKLRGQIGKGKPEALEAIDGLLENIQFTDAAVGKVAAAVAAAEKMRAEGLPVTLDPAQLRASRNWQAMKVEDLEAIYEQAKNLAHIAKKANAADKLAINAEFNEEMGALAAHIRRNRPADEGAGIPDANPDWKARVLKDLRSGDWHLRKIEFLARILDGGHTAGLFHQTVFQPIANAEAMEHKMFKELRDELVKLQKIVTADERYRHDQKVTFLTKRFAVRDVLAIALNLRNEGNMERMLASEGWKLADVLDRLDDILTDKDIELINKFGTLVESYWPDIKDVHTRVKGTPPKKVTGSPVALPSGRIIEGGYYPIIKDPEAKNAAASVAAKVTNDDDLWTEDTLPTVVGHEFTEERAQHAQTPMKLSLDVLPHHLVRVIHYISHYEVTQQVDKVIKDQRIKSAIQDGLGLPAYNELRPWLQAVVEDRETSADPMGYVEKFMRHSRMGASIVLLSYKLTVALTQGLGLTVTAKELGGGRQAAKYIGYGIRQVLRSMREGGFSPFEQVIESITQQDESFVLHRENYDRDLRQVYRDLTSIYSEFGKRKQQIVMGGMYMFNLVQGTVNAITWHAALQKATDEGHPNPVAYAASTVRMSQASGGPKDLSRFQRGTEWKKLWTVMFSYRNLAYNQMMEESPEGSIASKAWHKAGTFWYLAILPAILVTAARTNWGDDDAPEEAAWRLAMEIGSSTIGTMPVVEKGFSALTTGRDPSDAPWLRATWGALKSAHKLVGGDDLTATDFSNFSTALGVYGHLPTGAALNAYRYVDGLENMEDEWMNLLFRNKSDWK